MPLSGKPTSPLEGLSGFDPEGRVRLSPNDPDASRLLALYPGRYVMTSAEQAAPYLTPAASSPASSVLERPLDLSAGEYEDYFAIAREVLRELGVLGRDPTDQEIVFFAKTQMNAESVLAHYSNVPEIIEQQPGIPYGLSRRGYETRTRELAGAFASAFPGQRGVFPDSRATKSERESSLFGGALKAGVSGQEFGQTLSRFQQERGRAPSLSEFEERRNRPQPVVGPRPGFAGSRTAEEQRAGVSSVRPSVSRRAKT